MFNRIRCFFVCSLLIVPCSLAFAQTLHGQIAAASGGSIGNPLEIAVSADLTLNEPIIIEENQHIRLVPAGGNRTITRGSGLIEEPLIWVHGENSSLTLGKPGMEYELVFDGGYLSSPPIQARTPLASVSGPDSKLIMYDKVTIQNNYNNGTPTGVGFYEHGAGVFIRTEGDDIERQAEFIMKGGIIRGNYNDVNSSATSTGGGVRLAGMGIFTMEGGIIMDNIARMGAGGFSVGSRASIYKTGGIIYGKNAPKGYRNTGLIGIGSITTYGHAGWVAAPDYPDLYFRDDTIGENDSFSYTGVPSGPGTFGQEGKWNTPAKMIRQRIIIIAVIVLAAAVPAFIVIRKTSKKAAQKRLEVALASISAGEERSALNAVQATAEFTPKEKEVLELLFTDLPLREIARALKTTYSTVNYHSKNIYGKLGIHSRVELVTKFKK